MRSHQRAYYEGHLDACYLPQMNNLPDRGGMSLISKVPECVPSAASVQKSTMRLRRFKRMVTSCGAVPQLRIDTTSRLPNGILPTRKESSSNRAATPAGGCNLRSIANFPSLIFVKSSPDKSMPPDA